MYRRFCVLVFLIYVTASAQGRQCKLGLHSNVPTSIYDDLRCTGISDPAIDEHCPVKYDCSNIYDRPENTCHFQGKTYKIGESINDEELAGVWDSDCSCTESLEFSCPLKTDGCAEDWVGGYPGFGCYLKYKLHSYCADGQICPPFDGNAKCVVKGPNGDTTYKEGDKFGHPKEHCMQCVCSKGFQGTFDAPFCQPVNCTAELKHSKEIDNYCAPYYDYNEDSCCPKTWVCPSENGKVTPSPVGTPSNQPASEFFCKFGDKIMHIGDYYEHEDKELGSVYCQCDIPPFVTCMKPAEPVILNK